MRPAAIFSDHMVLQRDKKWFVFGESEAPEMISVEIDDIKKEEKVEAGRWEIMLPEHVAGGPYMLTIRALDKTSDDVGKSTSGTEKMSGINDNTSDKREYVYQDVYFGEVWIVNGQSNIEFELQNSRGGEKELSESDFNDIRYFKAIKTPVVDDVFLEEEKKLSWRTLQNGNFRDISGIGYFFAKKLHEKLGVTVGMVDCYQGGTSISCWLSEERLGAYPEGRLYIDEFEESVKGQTEEDYDRLLREYNALVEKHLTLTAKAKAENPDITPEELSAQAGDYPWPPPMGLKSAFRPCGLYHTMLERIAPFASKGLIYYQGEEDAGRNSRYLPLLKELIAEFKDLFRDERLPVSIIQLPMFIARGAFDERDWARIRAIQEKAVDAYDDASLISIIDCGEYDNVHPTDKKTPGERTALRILKDVYLSEEGAIESRVKEVTGENGRYKISFSDTYGALKTLSNELLDIRNELKDSEKEQDHIFGFEIKYDEDWHVPGKCYIEGDCIIIETDRKIDAIRYAFFNYGKVNLYNDKGMPVKPFETALS
ncbi:MAG: hypothetical protein K6C35_02015 [Eubacterium sp.]|nr:hypothetical protein [Eubacterium sp.]